MCCEMPKASLKTLDLNANTNTFLPHLCLLFMPPMWLSPSLVHSNGRSDDDFELVDPPKQAKVGRSHPTTTHIPRTSVCPITTAHPHLNPLSSTTLTACASVHPPVPTWIRVPISSCKTCSLLCDTFGSTRVHLAAMAGAPPCYINNHPPLQGLAANFVCIVSFGGSGLIGRFLAITLLAPR